MRPFVASLALALVASAVACGGSDAATDDANLTGAPCAPTGDGAIKIYDADENAPVLQPLSGADESRLLGRLFDRFHTQLEQCSSEEMDLETARDRGEIVPEVVGKVDGAFTAPNVQQTLYLVRLYECGATHADNFGTSLVVVMKGDELVARLPATGGSGVHRLVDLENDGRQEVVVTYGWAGQGYELQSAQIVSVKRESLTVVHDVGEVLEDACSTGNDGAERAWSVVHAIPRPGGAPEIKVEKKTRVCPPL